MRSASIGICPYNLHLLGLRTGGEHFAFRRD
jgi:hypothetical protein